MKKIKILHLVPGLDAGGISVLLLNYYKNMNRENIQFDFAIFYDSIGMTGREFKKMGSKIYHLPPKSKDFKGYCKKLYQIIKENDYDIIHAHQNYMSFIPLKIAKKAGVKVRISHSHTTAAESGLIKKVFSVIGKSMNKLYATDYFACGLKAGEFLYGRKTLKSNKFFLLNNAIDISKYVYDSKIREEVRNELNLKENYIIGTIGRLSSEKNQKFAIDIFKEVYKINNKSRFLIIGNGPLEEELKKYVAEQMLNDAVIFLGRRDDVNRLLQGMDLFILPSLYEGLPVTGVEAIASSIPCLFSTGVTKELKLRKNIDYISINCSEKWIKAIEKYRDYKRKENSKDIMIKNGYDIKTNAKILEEKYISLIKEKDHDYKKN